MKMAPICSELVRLACKEGMMFENPISPQSLEKRHAVMTCVMYERVMRRAQVEVVRARTGVASQRSPYEKK